MNPCRGHRSTTSNGRGSSTARSAIRPTSGSTARTHLRSSRSKPLAESRIGLIASGGIYREGQIAFHYRDDFSFRIIPNDTEMSTLRATHFAYDVTDARSDPNVVFPLETLRAQAREGGIGEVGANAYTFMGGIYSVRKVRDILAPALAERMEEDAVDAALLVPA